MSGGKCLRGGGTCPGGGGGLSCHHTGYTYSRNVNLAQAIMESLRMINIIQSLKSIKYLVVKFYTIWKVLR